MSSARHINGAVGQLQQPSSSRSRSDLKSARALLGFLPAKFKFQSVGNNLMFSQHSEW